MRKRDLFLAGLFGAVLGAVAALLLAPKTGKETRHILATRAGELWRRIGSGKGGTKSAT